MKVKLLGAAAAALALALPAVALASAANNVTLAKGETHQGTYYAAGQTVSVDGDVNGDVVCGAQTVTVNGAVNGDVICAAQNVTVNGPVTGSVRVAAQNVNINGTVGRNVTAAAQSLELGSGAHVSGEVALAGQAVTVDGPVDHDLYAAAKDLTMNAPVGGDVSAVMSSFNMSSSAHVTGDFTYTSPTNFNVDKSLVGGQVVYHAKAKPAPRENAATTWLQMLLFWIVAATATMLLAVWLVPRFARAITEAMLRRPGASFGWGALGLIVIPVLLFALLITVFGIPLAVWLGIAWILILAATGPLAGLALGQIVLRRETPDQKFLLRSVLVGVPLAIIAFSVPWLGGLLGLLACVWVFGGVILALNKARSLG
jgi:cytoskeletal protein CcmA (bactofilin family)